MRWFLRQSTVGREPLAVSMSGVRLGERVLQVGPGDPAVVGTLAARPGLTGQAAVVVADEASAIRARAAVADASALADVLTLPPDDTLPFEPDSFDVAIIHNQNDFLASLGPDRGERVLNECHRVVRVGGRVLVLDPGTPSGLRGLFRPGPTGDATGGTTIAHLEAAGFRAVRTLADRDGCRFVEAIRA